MVRTQAYLTEEQQRGLKQLAATSGRKQSELIRDAVDGYLAERRPKNWKEALEAIRGMWADRDDVDDLHAEVGRDWERRMKRPGDAQCPPLSDARRPAGAVSVAEPRSPAAIMPTRRPSPA